ncbi:hypothetical protein QJQ45_027027, partial [Haematococcus lacustris]
ASKDLEARMARKKAQTRGPGSEAGSQHSYPATPSFSQASGSVANSQVQSRLAQLEEDLARERMRRREAEEAAAEAAAWALSGVLGGHEKGNQATKA